MAAIPRVSYVYVDGESHYHRSEACFTKRHPNVMFTDLNGQMRQNVSEKLRFYWDETALSNRIASRYYYFTSIVGNDAAYTESCEYLRGHNFDPQIVREAKDLYKNRRESLDKLNIIEKPKGVDIGLTTMMIDDAAKNNCQTIYLFTSDSDYLPAIRAVRSMGKVVHVYGYSEGIGNKELIYVPDYFHDLGYDIQQIEVHRLRPKA